MASTSCTTPRRRMCRNLHAIDATCRPPNFNYMSRTVRPHAEYSAAPGLLTRKGTCRTARGP
jgi:hypothetical protein